MRAGASHIEVDRQASCGKCRETLMVTMHGAETRLLKMSILMVFYIYI